MRKCLKCRRDFQEEHSGNFVCPECKRKNDKLKVSGVRCNSKTPGWKPMASKGS